MMRSFNPVAAGFGLALAAAAVPFVAFLQARAVVPVAILAAIMSLGLARKAVAWRLDIGRPLAAILVLACLWAAVSTPWAPDTWLGTRGALKLAGNLLLGAVLFSAARKLDADGRRWIAPALLFGFGFTLVLLFVEELFKGPISVGLRGLPYRGPGGFFWLNASAAILILIIWPASLRLWQRHRGALIIAAFGLVALILYLMTYWTGLVSLIAGVIAAFCVYAFTRRAGIILAVLFALGVAAAPLLPSTALKPDTVVEAVGDVPPPLMHRLHIWEFTSQRIAEHPIRGWGMNASRVIPGRKNIVEGKAWSGYVMPLHPHNAVLQVWLELGAPGALLFGVLGVLVFLGITRPHIPRVHAAAAAGQVMTALALLCSSYGIWQSWWLATLWVSASLMAVTMSERKSQGLIEF
ncbi:MAG: O-antigen ligase family protein [Rhodospirillales bacterium]|nr:O-antigen ligase family protein [Rhodospirillales bacterium]HJO73344.1 O-antigen ligase family protein [Rhodospirillales bacterium]